MAPEGGAAMDSFLFDHLDSFGDAEKQRINVVLRGFANADKVAWPSKLAIDDSL